MISNIGSSAVGLAMTQPVRNYDEICS
jgi:hypothetical protein